MKEAGSQADLQERNILIGEGTDELNDVCVAK
jgi:hypothetical protein